MGKELKIILVLVAAVILSLGWVFFFIERNRPVETITKIERHTDTIKLRDPVPVYTTLKSYQFFDFPVEKVVYVDSSSHVQVEIPIEQKTYRDSNYMAIVSGFQPNLDYIETYNNTTTITTTNVVHYRPLVSLGVGATAGWSPITKNWDVIVGVNVTIPI